MVGKRELQQIQALRGSHGRRREGSFVAEGLRLVEALLQAGLAMQAGYVAKEDLLAQFAGLPVERCSMRFLEQATQLTSPPAIVAIFGTPSFPLPKAEGELILGLEEVQNPGNLGSILRTADWFGIRHVICSLDSAQAYSPKAIQASMGAVAHVRVAYAPLEEYIDTLPVGYPVICTTLHGKPIASWQLPEQGLILFGNEGRGLSAALQARATEIVSIPSIGRPTADSLNVAAAVAIVLSKVAEGRR